MTDFKHLNVQQAHKEIETAGRFVIDTRLPFDYFGGRIPGSLNLPGKSIQSRTTHVPVGRPLLIVAEDDEFGGEVCVLARTLGFEDVANLQGGMDAWNKAEFPTDTISEGLGPVQQPPKTAPTNGSP
jgi:rhodanese-related sulfurtransferase